MTGGQLTHGWVRLTRGTILGGTSLILATAAHLAGGGTLPGAGLLAMAGVAVAMVAVSLTARRVRFGPLLLVLGIEQVLLHLLFHAASAATTCATVVMPGHGMSGAGICGTGSTSEGTTGWAMVLAHAVAVAATAWLLASGERWLWRMVDRVHAYATARPTPRRRRPPVPGPRAIRHLVTVGWLSADPRGPPPVAI